MTTNKSTENIELSVTQESRLFVDHYLQNYRIRHQKLKEARKGNVKKVKKIKPNDEWDPATGSFKLKQ